MDKFDYTEIKDFCPSKSHHKHRKRISSNWEKTFAIHVPKKMTVIQTTE